MVSEVQHRLELLLGGDVMEVHVVGECSGIFKRRGKGGYVGGDGFGGLCLVVVLCFGGLLCGGEDLWKRG